MNLKKNLKRLLTNLKIIKELKIPEYKVQIEYPADLKFGSYSSNLALIASKQAKTNPRELAEKIVDELKANPEFQANYQTEIAGPGFINFDLKDNFIKESIQQLFDLKAAEIYEKTLKNQKIMVEYAHPNPFKSFHIGHLRNIIIGESVARILEASGAKVVRTNYQGDVGLHVAKFFYGFYNSKEIDSQELKTIDQKVDFMADCYVKGHNAYKDDPKAKEEINTLNKLIFKKDSKILEDWQEKREWSLQKFEEIYQRLGSKFDKYYFESQMAEEGAKISEKAYQKGVLIKDDVCLIFKGEKYNLNNRVFVNKLGIPTYEGKELALAYKEFTDFGDLDQVIHVVANEQDNFFKITFFVEKLLDEKLFGDKQTHISYGMVQLKGEKMSSRLGNIVLGETILNKAKEKILELMTSKENLKNKELSDKEKEKISETLAIASVKYSFLKVNPKKDILFDLKESVSLEGQSGPYIMYSYVRATNILKNPEINAILEDIKLEKIKISLNNLVELSEPEKKLALNLIKFSEIIEQTVQKYQLSFLAEYAYEIANQFSNFYNYCPVTKEKDEAKKIFRVYLIQVYQKILKQCFYLMGIKTIERM
jgi:arginyl-tRNA synthetase